MSFLTQSRRHDVMMPDMATPRLQGWHFLLFNLVLGLAHMAVLFNAASYIAFLPHVAGDLGGVLPSFGTWAQTDFMIALALAFPIARWLSERFGESRVFIGACLAYAAASSLCAVSDSLALFLPARVLLGFAGGITLPIGQALLLREYPDRLKSVALGVWGFFTLMPFTIGLPIGGWIADELGWRYLFYLNVPVAGLIAGVTWALMTGRPFELRRLRFDYIGYLLLALILGGIQTILNEGNDFDWWDSYVLRGLLLMVVIAVPCWIIWEWEEADPAVDLRLFRSRNFAIGLIGLTAGFFALQGLLSLFVVQLQLLMGYSSYLAGMVFLPMIIFGMPVIAVMHEIAKRVDMRRRACVCRGSKAAGCGANWPRNAGSTMPPWNSTMRRCWMPCARWPTASAPGRPRAPCWILITASWPPYVRTGAWRRSVWRVAWTTIGKCCGTGSRCWNKSMRCGPWKAISWWRWWT
jgi:DHA2 family multidrug resistance protein